MPKVNLSNRKPDRPYKNDHIANPELSYELHSDSNNQELTLQDFEYDLPKELIAQKPTSVRHKSRLMVINRTEKTILHHTFEDLVALLTPGDVLVVNNTKVLPAKLKAHRLTNGQIELLLLKPEVTSKNIWLALASPARKLKAGETLLIKSSNNTNKSFPVTVTELVVAPDGQKRVLLDLGNSENVSALLSQAGYAPLPPYIARDNDINSQHAQMRAADLVAYQTVFASEPGAVAAPTAGLHFSEELLAALSKKGIEICYITLHVGPGTFKPITTSLAEHSIEPEEFSIPAETVRIINSARLEKRRIIAVGTTTCRALESAVIDSAAILDKVSNKDPARTEIAPAKKKTTSLYIKPGYKFQVIDGLITNFHLSRSSLLVLVSAFAGHKLIMAAYKEAISQHYRFYSYGDAMLIV